MPINPPQTLNVVFAILTLFAASASGQHLGGDIPVYQPDEGVFDSDDVSEEVSEFFKAGIEDEIRPTDSDQAASKASQASYQSPSAQAAESLIDRDGYLKNVAGGGIWADAISPPASATPVIPPTPQLQSPADASVSTRSVLTDGLTNAIGNGQLAAQESAGDLPAASAQAISQAPILAASPADYAQVQPGPSKFRLRLGFDILAWERGQPNDDIFATEEGGNRWSFSDFDLTDSTPRFFVQFMGDDLTGYELSFFDFNTFESTIAATGSNVTPMFFGGQPSNLGPEFDLNYNSRLKNIELNSWVRHNDIQRSGYGIRYINLDENFDVIRGNNVNTGLFSRTDNNMWGLNRMWERRRPLLKRLDFTGGLDLGLYINDAQIDVDTLNIDDSSDANNLAGSLGFNFGLEYLVADHVTFRFGYEGLALFGVALASTQSLEQRVVDGLDDPELSSLFFGGFHFGAIASF